MKGLVGLIAIILIIALTMKAITCCQQNEEYFPDSNEQVDTTKIQTIGL